jgi:histidine ammonia-lyase
VDGFFAGLGQDPAGRPLGLSLRYPAAAVFAELKHLAAPATLDTPTLDLGIEDHASGAPLSVRLTDRSLDLTDHLGSDPRRIGGAPGLTAPILTLPRPLRTSPIWPDCTRPRRRGRSPAGGRWSLWTSPFDCDGWSLSHG